MASNSPTSSSSAQSDCAANAAAAPIRPANASAARFAASCSICCGVGPTWSRIGSPAYRPGTTPRPLCTAMINHSPCRQHLHQTRRN